MSADRAGAPQDAGVSRDGAAYASATGRAEAHFYHFSHDKAGMGGVDKAKVAAVVHAMSEGSKFYENEERRDTRIQRRIEAKRRRWESLRPGRGDMAGAEAVVSRELAAHEAGRDLSRVWAVIDMDQFFAAVEERDRPELAGRPMAVGGTGMLSTANYAARRFGVRSAMPGFIALKLCPQLAIVKPDYGKYKAAGRIARAVFRRFDPGCSCPSLDECYLDLTAALAERGARPPASGQGWGAGAEPGPAGVERGTGMLAPSGGGSVSALLARGSTDAVTGPAAEDEEEVEEDGGADDDQASGVEREAGRSAGSGREGRGAAAQAGAAGFALLSRPGDGGGGGVSSSAAFHAAVWDLVEEIRCAVREATGGLTCSAGVAANAMLAKVASDMNKPNGQCVVPFGRADVLGFVGALPVRKLPGIGRVTETELAGLGLGTVADVRREAARLRCVLTPRMASWLLRVSLGIAATTREDGGSSYRRKSLSLERTFRDEARLSVQLELVTSLAERLAGQMRGEAAAFTEDGEDGEDGGGEGASGAETEGETGEGAPSSGDRAAGGEQAPPRTAVPAAEGDAVRRRQARGHVPGFFGGADSSSEEEGAGPRRRPVMRGRTVTVKLKLSSFRVLQRSSTLEGPSNSASLIAAECRRIVRQEHEAVTQATGRAMSLRLLGVKVHNLVFEGDVSDAGTLDALIRRKRPREPASQRESETPARAAGPQVTMMDASLPARAAAPATKPREAAQRGIPARGPAADVAPACAGTSTSGQPEADTAPAPSSVMPAPAPCVPRRPGVLQQMIERRMRSLREAPSAKRPRGPGGGQASLTSFVRRVR